MLFKQAYKTLFSASADVIETIWMLDREGLTIYKECKGSLDDVLTISKTNPKSHFYKARRVSDYLNEFYPSFGSRVFLWITNLCKTSEEVEKTVIKVDAAEEQITLADQTECATLVGRLKSRYLTFKMLATSENFAVEVKSALDWALSVLRPQPKHKKGLYTTSLNHSSLDDWLPGTTVFILGNAESYCWTKLFSYADITNLPPSKVLRDSEKEGLEIAAYGACCYRPRGDYR
jgi:hypothetical protein